MSQITRQIGERLRALRLAAGLTQERLAERAEMHATYIGQLERGEKNATVESLCRLARALDIAPARLFLHLPGERSEQSPTGPADEIYQLLLECPPKEQRALLDLLRQLLRYKRL